MAKTKGNIKVKTSVGHLVVDGEPSARLQALLNQPQKQVKRAKKLNKFILTDMKPHELEQKLNHELLV